MVTPQTVLLARRHAKVRWICAVAVCLVALASSSFAAEKPRIQVNDYVIHAGRFS